MCAEGREKRSNGRGASANSFTLASPNVIPFVRVYPQRTSTKARFVSDQETPDGRNEDRPKGFWPVSPSFSEFALGSVPFLIGLWLEYREHLGFALSTLTDNLAKMRERKERLEG